MTLGSGGEELRQVLHVSSQKWGIPLQERTNSNRNLIMSKPHIKSVGERFYKVSGLYSSKGKVMKHKEV